VSTLSDIIDALVPDQLIERIDSSIDIIREKVYEFKLIPQKIRAAERRLAMARQVVEARGDGGALVELAGAEAATAELAGDWEGANAKLDTVLPAMQAAGLGLIPIALAIAIGVAATAIVYVMVKAGTTWKLLDQVERNVLTPAEAAQLAGATSPGLVPDLLGKAALPIMGLLAAIYLGPPLVAAARKAVR